jgi:hypothetical protein
MVFKVKYRNVSYVAESVHETFCMRHHALSGFLNHGRNITHKQRKPHEGYSGFNHSSVCLYQKQHFANRNRTAYRGQWNRWLPRRERDEERDVCIATDPEQTELGRDGQVKNLPAPNTRSFQNGVVLSRRLPWPTLRAVRQAMP